MNHYQTSKLLTVSEAIAARHSVRDFLPKEVSLELIYQILDEARHACSSSNLQPWKLYLIHGETKKMFTKIIKKKFFKGGIDGPAFPMFPGMNAKGSKALDTSKFKKNYPKYGARQSAMGKLIYDAQGIKRNDIRGRMFHMAKNWDFFGAPIGVFISIEKGMSIGQYPDLGIILSYIMLLCQQYGLSTCAQVAWSLWNPTIKEVLDIPSNELIFCGISIGYENKKTKVNQIRTERMKFNEYCVVPKISNIIQSKL